MSPNDLITIDDILLLCYSITDINLNQSSRTQHTVQGGKATHFI
jgi:hypothetical protein